VEQDWLSRTEPRAPRAEQQRVASVKGVSTYFLEVHVTALLNRSSTLSPGSDFFELFDVPA